MVDFQDWSFLFFICIISTIFIWKRFSKSSSAKSRHPPTPFGLPIIGHLHLVNPVPHKVFHKLSLRHGPIFRVFMGSVPCVVACSPEIAKEFLKTNEESFSNRPLSSTQHYITYGSNDFVFAPYGPYWKFMKKIVTSQLLNGKTLDLLSSVRHDEINRFIISLSENAKINNSVDLSGEFIKLTNNVISRMVMSKRCTDEDGEVGQMIADITEISGSFNLSDYVWLLKTLDVQGLGRRVKDTRLRYDLVIERILEEHDEARKNKKTGQVVKDLLDILLDIEQDESSEIKLTRENIKAFVLNLIVAGTDTTATSLEWAMAELINHPNIMKKAAQEIHQVVGKKRLIQESDIPNLPYLQAIVKETLRLHPSFPVIPRESPQDCIVAGYHIPAKTNIFINVWAINIDPNHWDNPHEFRPERFEENMLEARGQHFHLLTFGSGRRMCPGISLAQHILHTTLGAMIQCFEWKAGKDGNLSSVDMEERSGLSIPRANPLVCVPVARLDPVPFSM
ncbi:cytochrome P450 93A3 [Artemisia annua]|uniref:Cytochrome P450 93A3 n=1 Tax=Artemisia annua TaxID=35608 RepID=A0A2U1QM23_ARTAN|nr:cytochrome P450 93A3 [Artemisia annua]